MQTISRCSTGCWGRGGFCVGCGSFVDFLWLTVREIPHHFGALYRDGPLRARLARMGNLRSKVGFWDKRECSVDLRDVRRLDAQVYGCISISRVGVDFS